MKFNSYSLPWPYTDKSAYPPKPSVVAVQMLKHSTILCVRADDSNGIIDVMTPEHSCEVETRTFQVVSRWDAVIEEMSVVSKTNDLFHVGYFQLEVGDYDTTRRDVFHVFEELKTPNERGRIYKSLSAHNFRASGINLAKIIKCKRDIDDSI